MRTDKKALEPSSPSELSKPIVNITFDALIHLHIIICVSFCKCRVTLCSGLPGTGLVQACCTGVIITNSPFHSRY